MKEKRKPIISPKQKKRILSPLTSPIHGNRRGHGCRRWGERARERRMYATYMAARFPRLRCATAQLQFAIDFWRRDCSRQHAHRLVGSVALPGLVVGHYQPLADDGAGRIFKMPATSDHARPLQSLQRTKRSGLLPIRSCSPSRRLLPLTRSRPLSRTVQYWGPTRRYRAPRGHPSGTRRGNPQGVRFS